MARPERPTLLLQRTPLLGLTREEILDILGEPAVHWYTLTSPGSEVATKTAMEYESVIVSLDRSGRAVRVLLKLHRLRSL
jgi:hypothetical protein